MSKLLIEDPSILGPCTTPGAAAGASNPQTILDTVQVIGPLPEGKYTIEPDVDCRVVQGNAATLTDGTNASPLNPNAVKATATLVRQIGVRCPANTETVLQVKPGKDYIAWVTKTAGVTGSDFRVNTRENGYTS